MKTSRVAQVLEVRMDEVEQALKRAKSSLDQKDYELLKALAESYQYVSHVVETKQMTIQQLRKLLFGSTSEKTDKVVGSREQESAAAAETETTAAADADGTAPPKRRKGHGRNGAKAYEGGERIAVPHESLCPGDRCPDCTKGKVYRLPDPAVLVRVTGQAPLRARVFERERLRCNLCGKIFTAPAPQGIGEQKYDAASASMIGLLRYGSGLPFNRLERLEGNLGIPLPASTQWDIVESAARKMQPAYTELLRQAARGEVLHNDDTPMKVLSLLGERQGPDDGTAEDDEESDDGSERTGVFTTGVVSRVKENRIALFFTGRQHAGENLADVLRERAKDLPPPIQMCDGLARNLPKDLAVIVANCLAHGRRKFVEVEEDFPDECRHVLEALTPVYHHDALAMQQGLSPDDRLHLHQTHSGPVMKELHEWLQSQIQERKVEPNSRLGKAIRYLLKRWDKLTLFLRVPGAPLDNNLCERALKKAIMHRKNSLFYKTENGARVGDLFMTLIHTAELCGANAFDYLSKLQLHAEAVNGDPAAWMPWNYRDALSATRAP